MQEAERWFQQDLRLAPADFYVRAAYADLMLQQARPAEALALLAGQESFEPLLLRIAIAQKQLRDPALTQSSARLRAAFAAELQRGEAVHRREQARFLLEVQDQPEPSLAAALENWSVQHEPDDVLVLMRAARAAGNPARCRGRPRLRARSRSKRRARRCPDPRNLGVAMNPLLRNLLMLVLLLAGRLAQAHIASNGFLSLKVEGSKVSGAIELAIRDGELAVGLDHDGNGKVTWGELKSSQGALQSYVQGHLRLRGADGPCRLTFAPVEVNERVDGSYLWLPITADCGSVLQRLSIEYTLLDAEDPSHRGLLTLFAKGRRRRQSWAAVSELGSSSSTMSRRGLPSSSTCAPEFGISGAASIICCFCCPCCCRRYCCVEQNRWEAVPIAGPAFLNIVKVVTAFTLAHSITLSLAAFDVIRLPSRLTESVIAASIIIAALNNVFPRVTEGRWRIAFAFGLLHGFGFASVLAEMGLPKGARLISLVAFNLGVEAGQLVVVLAVMPLVYFLRATHFYRRGIMPWGSSAIACLALFWFVQRALL